MGVPVFTLTGINYISRQSASLLGSIGLSELIVKNKNNYIKTLKKLVNLNTIIKFRYSLREKIKKLIFVMTKIFIKILNLL